MSARAASMNDAGASLEFGGPDHGVATANHIARRSMLPPITTTFPDDAKSTPSSTLNSPLVEPSTASINNSPCVGLSSPTSSPTSTTTPQIENFGGSIFPSFSKDSSKSLVASTTVGGTILLALLIYALWRRNQLATLDSRISTPILKQQPQNERLTALPLYSERRHKVSKPKFHSLNRHEGRQKRVSLPFWSYLPFSFPSFDSNSDTSSTLSSSLYGTEVKSHSVTVNPVAPYSPPPSYCPEAQTRANLLWPLERTYKATAVRIPPPALTPLTGRPLDTIPERWSWSSTPSPTRPPTALGHYRSASASPSNRPHVAALAMPSSRPAVPSPAVLDAVKGRAKPEFKNQALKPVLSPRVGRGSARAVQHTRVGSLSSIIGPAGAAA